MTKNIILNNDEWMKALSKEQLGKLAIAQADKCQYYIVLDQTNNKYTSTIKENFLEFLNAWNASNTSPFGDKLTVINIIRIVEDKIDKENPEDYLTLIEQKLNAWKNGENVAEIEELNKLLSALKLENER